MIDRRFAILVALTAFMLLLIPAALASGYTISGHVAFPANTTLAIDPNTTVKVTSLAVIAMNTSTGFENNTICNADGTYSIAVPGPGIYRIWVEPSEVYDATNKSKYTQLVYPQRPPGDRVYFVAVNGNLKDVDVNYFQAGQYVPPNNLTANSPVPSPSQSPGFAALIALAGLLGAFALAGRRR